ncbi:Carrier protein, mitochondrial [Thecaphora frezii]
MSAAASHRHDSVEPEAYPSMAYTSLEHHRHASTSSHMLDDSEPSDPFASSSRKPVTRSKKAVAAITGAVATSFLMTPFDVIKTRLQTQSTPEPLFVPSKHLPTTAFTVCDALSPPPAASSAASSSSTRLRYAGIGRVGAHPATCCQQTFFSANNQEQSLTCRYDPRQPTAATAKASRPMRAIARSSLSHSTNHTSSFSASAAPRSSVRILPSPPPVPNGYPHPTPMATIANGASSCACAFPDRSIAARELEAAAAQQGRLTGLWDGVVKVGRAEGIRGLWRGLTPTLAMSVPSQVTYMTCYDYFRSLLLANEDPAAVRAQYEEATESSSGVLTKSPSLSPITPHSLGASLVAGAAARAISATLVTPLELIRTRQQAASGTNSSLRPILGMLMHEMRTSREGPLILWRGLAPTLWRDVPFSALYFAGYESCKRILTGGGLGEGNAKGSGEEFGIAFFSGAVSGGVAAVVTHPFDLVKTRLQAEQQQQQHRGVEGRVRLSASLRERTRETRGVFGIVRDVVEREGVKGLFKGLSPRTAKVAPACGVMIASFEVVGRLLSE